MTRTVLIAGSTGYLGRYLVAEYMKRGWNVIALVRKIEGAPEATKVVQAQVTDPETLRGTMDGVELVVSSVGITRQRDGLTYRDVDYQANVNLLEEALRAGVPRFAYIHVLRGEELAHLTPIGAKQDFVNKLLKANIQSTVISPSGFFSDMKDFLDMAKEGRVWLFGDGQNRINPIHGEDLAKAAADAIEEGRTSLDVGGPDVLTHTEIAELAFTALGKPPKITRLWDGFRTFLITILPWITPVHVNGPAQFFLTAMGMDMVGECHGDHHLKDYFASISSQMSPSA